MVKCFFFQNAILPLKIHSIIVFINYIIHIIFPYWTVKLSKLLTFCLKDFLLAICLQNFYHLKIYQRRGREKQVFVVVFVTFSLNA